MHRMMILLILSALTTSPGWAAEEDTDGVLLSSSAEASEITRGELSQEIIGLKPQVGVVVFRDQFLDTSTRGIAGLTADMNLASALSRGPSPVYMGLSSGILYSHLGDPGSNLVGLNSGTNIAAGNSNLYLIPANLKLGYHLGNSFRLGVHGGGNVIYRTVANSLFLGTSSLQTGSVWSIFPNAGGDVEFNIARNTALMLRPDWTFSPGDMFFTGTLALNILLG